MEVILTQRCKSLTGELGSGFGYHIQRRKNGFFAKRNSKGVVPPDGHWKFIVSCAELAQLNLHIADIRVTRDELIKAVEEAGWCLSRFMENLRPTLNAKDILTFKQETGL